MSGKSDSGIRGVVRGMGNGARSAGTIANKAKTNTTDKITGAATGTMQNTGLWVLVAAGAFLLMILGLVMNYISSVFTFIFLESLDKKKVLIKKGWKKNQMIGWSLFWFRLIYGLGILGVIAVSFGPASLYLWGSGAFADSKNHLLLILGLLVISALVFLCLITIVAIFGFLVGNFSVTHMYFKKKLMWRSIKETFRKIRKNKVEVMVYFVAKVVLGIVIGLISALIVIIALIPSAIVFGPVALLLFLLGKTMMWSVAGIAIVVIAGIILFLIWIYALNVLFLPFSVFGKYFIINNYKAMMKN